MYADEVLAQRIPELLVGDTAEERVTPTLISSTPKNADDQPMDANVDTSAEASVWRGTRPRSPFSGLDSSCHSSGAPLRRGDVDDLDNGGENGELSSGREAEGRKTLGPSVGRCDFQLQEDLADMEWFGAFRAHFCYWRHDDVALFIARAVCGYDVLDGSSSA
jgi:hypothetical protein